MSLLLWISYNGTLGSTAKPEDMYRIIEHFALGRRRLELFGEDHNIRSGWLTVGTGLSSSNFNSEVCSPFSDEHFLSLAPWIDLSNVRDIICSSLSLYSVLHSFFFFYLSSPSVISICKILYYMFQTPRRLSEWFLPFLSFWISFSANPVFFSRLFTWIYWVW